MDGLSTWLSSGGMIGETKPTWKCSATSRDLVRLHDFLDHTTNVTYSNIDTSFLYASSVSDREGTNAEDNESNQAERSPVLLYL